MGRKRAGRSQVCDGGRGGVVAGEWVVLKESTKRVLSSVGTMKHQRAALSG